MHQRDFLPLMSLRQIKLTVGATPVGTAHTWSYPSTDNKIYIVPTYGLTVVGRNDAGMEVRGWSLAGAR